MQKKPKMKTKRTTRVYVNVRNNAIRRYEKQTDSRSAIQLLNELMQAARTEMRLFKTVDVRGSMRNVTTEEVEITCGEMRILIDFKGGREAV